MFYLSTKLSCFSIALWSLHWEPKIFLHVLSYLKRLCYYLKLSLIPWHLKMDNTSWGLCVPHQLWFIFWFVSNAKKGPWIGVVLPLVLLTFLLWIPTLKPMNPNVICFSTSLFITICKCYCVQIFKLHMFGIKRL